MKLNVSVLTGLAGLGLFLAGAGLAGVAGCVGLGSVGPRNDAGASDTGASGSDGASGTRDGGTDAAGATDSTVGADSGTTTGTDSGPTGAVCPPIGPLDCSPGPGTGEADTCIDDVSCFLDDVQSAVTGVIAAYPAWFDYANMWMCPFILDIDGFMDAVVVDLVGQGVCAIRDPNAPGEEVTVKHDNAYAENFDIVASNGCARWGDLIYTSTCSPAWW